jgi:hypothetical protein
VIWLLLSTLLYRTWIGLHSILNDTISIVFWISATQVETKMKCLNSVLEKLKNTDQLGQSTAMAYAHYMRAQVHLDCNNDHQLAKQDIEQAMVITSTTGYLLPTCAWTILADAEEKNGNVRAAMEAWRQLANAYPSYATKVDKEVKRLQLMG